MNQPKQEEWITITWHDKEGVKKESVSRIVSHDLHEAASILADLKALLYGWLEPSILEDSPPEGKIGHA